jgi:hypothetical protein
MEFFRSNQNALGSLPQDPNDPSRDLSPPEPTNPEKGPPVTPLHHCTFACQGAAASSGRLRERNVGKYIPEEPFRQRSLSVTGMFQIRLQV